MNDAQSASMAAKTIHRLQLGSSAVDVIDHVSLAASNRPPDPTTIHPIALSENSNHCSASLLVSALRTEER